MNKYAYTPRRSFRRPFPTKAMAVGAFLVGLFLFTGLQPSPELMEWQRRQCDDLGSGYNVAASYDYKTHKCTLTPPVIINE